MPVSANRNEQSSGGLCPDNQAQYRGRGPGIARYMPARFCFAMAVISRVSGRTGKGCARSGPETQAVIRIASVFDALPGGQSRQGLLERRVVEPGREKFQFFNGFRA